MNFHARQDHHLLQDPWITQDLLDHHQPTSNKGFGVQSDG